MKILLLTIIMLFFLYLILICPRLKKTDCSPFVNRYFAHRGLYSTENGIPENSLAAFRRAVDAGYGIELDVRLSSDGIPVVFHDATLSRMCAIDKRVDSITFDQLKNYNLANTKERIPAFSEVLALVGGRVPLLVEIKMEHIDLNIPEKINKLLSGYSGLYCIESFHPAALWWYRKNRPDIMRGQLSTHFNVENHTFSPLQYLLGKMVLNIISRPDFISYNWRFHNDLSLFLCGNIFKAHKAGWVIRSEKEMQTCRKYFNMYIFEDFLPEKDKSISFDRSGTVAE